MNRKLLIAVGGAATLILIAAIIAYQTWFSPRARIKTGVERAAAAFLARDRAAILGLISDDFDQDGIDKGKVDQALSGF
ncbi:MAG TPA: hypothetical protein VMF29_05000, partial [Candidatus Edwardsbacteria bacterium]|nr:hypothetical protein [Candidatus Edwardsbacteria bacterium]